jgi:hypothetical protein
VTEFHELPVEHRCERQDTHKPSGRRLQEWIESCEMDLALYPRHPEMFEAILVALRRRSNTEIASARSMVGD